jgi:hypothetical protein
LLREQTAVIKVLSAAKAVNGLLNQLWPQAFAASSSAESDLFHVKHPDARRLLGKTKGPMFHVEHPARPRSCRRESG